MSGFTATSVSPPTAELCDVSPQPPAPGPVHPSDVAALIHAARDFREGRKGEVPHDVAQFASLLRFVGLGVSVPAVLTALRAMALVRLDRREDVHVALRCALASTQPETVVFDIVFPVFWRVEDDQSSTAGPDEEGAGPEGARGEVPQAAAGRAELVGAGDRLADGIVERATYSLGASEPAGPLLAPHHNTEIEHLARRMARAIGTSKSRRRRVSSVGDVIEVRDSLRHNLGHGDELVVLRRSSSIRRRARMVVLCDVSSSMRPYMLLFLAFVHALTKTAPSVETAIFNVETSFVTDVFKRRSLPDALRWLDAQTIALAGGTRIGHSLRSFNHRLHELGALRHGTTAVVLSDGWDVGDLGLLHEQMARLSEPVDRVVWLDPHAAAAGYRPAVRGMRTVLPFVDAYLDFSDMSALRGLVQRLESGTMSVRRPDRIATGQGHR